IAGAEALVVGDPRASGTQIGPLISSEAADRVESWVRNAEQAGAKLHTPLDRDGACIRPVILTEVSPDMQVSCAEIFGPVVSVLPFDSFDQVIASANASPFGL